MHLNMGQFVLLFVVLEVGYQDILYAEEVFHYWTILLAQEKANFVFEEGGDEQEWAEPRDLMRHPQGEQWSVGKLQEKELGEISKGRKKRTEAPKIDAI